MRRRSWRSARASKNFGSLAAVSDVSMRVEHGELRAVIGPNGAGKTTFFNLITGFFPPTAGKSCSTARSINDIPAAGRVRLGMGRTFQITEIFPELTVRENVRIARRNRTWIQPARLAQPRRPTACRGRVG